MSDPAHAPLPPAGQAVYAISVAAELSGVGIQTLRLYEQHGLISPVRSEGGTRRYSGADLARLARVSALAGQGINLAGIARILDLEDANTALRETNNALTAQRDHDPNRHRPLR
ncbi:MerR family transcriptional regulator [Nocardia tengchongensis]|uniref:MerR family transcriptional regulator n=1 Tax=Nocardia tengchongensis TaxID=2055889 RepID=A0ABX8CKG5_9NOCA|nr:MerR family transcriptional regulator [Nocardia tengchongensis]QVI19816.1 MerR family transcriptional regulator [Nocardia tengchongensis]